MRLELPTSRFYLGRDYSEAVFKSGGIPLHLALIPDRAYIREALSGLDAVLLPGSNTDVDPQRYGAEPHHRLGTVIPEKDETDLLVLEEAERLGLPVLAICFGMQALNVYRGGTLIQDIQSEVPGSIKHEQGMPATRPSHSLEIDRSSVLASLKHVRAANGSVRVNSSHHQAVRDLGRGLKAIAWASDGIVECVIDPSPGRFVLGVQWHPELTARDDGISKDIFDLFVEHARGHNTTDNGSYRDSVEVMHEVG
jgi:putative glutamine amidotransferase